jgi:3-hydroxyacyl-[acyl-carrier-protein] dehydratase
MNAIINAIKKSAIDPAQKKDSGIITGRYLFSEDFLGFSGHFPGYPILPAVVQLITGLCLAEELKGHSLELKSVQGAKFLQEIRPGNEIAVTCTDSLVKGEPGCRILIHSGEKTMSSFLMTFY